MAVKHLKKSFYIRLFIVELVISLAVTFWFLRIPGCGEQQLQKEDTPQASLPPGERPKTDCGRVTFKEIQPIITAKCVSCHPGFDQFATASAKGATMVTRVNLDAGDPRRMPKAPADPLPDSEKQLFKLWQSDGLIEACPTSSPGKKTAYNFDDIERAIEDAGNSLTLDERLDSRFLVLTHKINQGLVSNDMQVFTAAADKGVNSLNVITSRLERLYPLGPELSILRIQLRDFGLSKRDWENVQKFDPFHIVSQTKRGQNIAQLFQEEAVWMHFDNFLVTVYRNANLYYSLIGILGLSRDQVLQKLGVDFNGDQRAFVASFIGTSRSPISDQKPRLITRFRSNDGDAWLTFDPQALNGVQARNLFSSPLLIDTKKIFEFAANELIFQLKNNLQAYALFDAKGKLLPKADIGIVRDVQSPVKSEIDLGSCSRCHAGGMIPAVDEIKAHVKANSSNFADIFNGLTDANRVDALYHEKKDNDLLFVNYNKIHVDALKDLNTNPVLDPITFATDKLELNWDLNQLCSFLFLDQKTCTDAINSSAQGRQELGGVLTGASVTFDQVKIGLPFVIRDARLFADPLGK